MKKFLQIQDGLVLICGPTTSGKTTLAKRIIREAPYQDKLLVSHDDALREFIKERGYPEEKYYSGLDKDDDFAFRSTVAKTISQALNEKKFVVHESVYCIPQNLAALLTFMPAWGLNRPLTLIKMWPSWQLHMVFISKCPNREMINPDAVQSQRCGFKEVIRPNHFAKHLECVKEYTIEDPREIVLDFRKKGELSKELLAAFEAREGFCEKYPDITQ